MHCKLCVGWVQAMQLADCALCQVYGIVGLCSDLTSKTQVITLPDDSACPVKWTNQGAVKVQSDSSPPAFWNTYYRCGLHSPHHVKGQERLAPAVQAEAVQHPLLHERAHHWLVLEVRAAAGMGTI